MPATKHPCKGTVLKLGTGGIEVPVAQLFELDVGAQTPESFEADDFDNASAGIPFLPTGRTEQGDITGNLFYNRSLHAAIAVFSQSPGTYTQVDSSTTITGRVEIPDGQSTPFTFTAATVGIGPWPFRLNDGLKMGLTIKTSGLVNIPTS